MQKSLLILWLLIAACLWSPTANAEAKDLLLLHVKTGHVIQFKLANDPKVTFDNGSVTVATNQADSETTYKIAEVKRFSFANESSVNNVKVDAKVIVEPNSLTVDDLLAGDTVFVYSLTGALEQTAAAGADGCVIFDIDTLPRGYHIVKTPSAVFKIKL